MREDDVHVHCIVGISDALVVDDADVTIENVFGLSGNQPESLMGGENGAPLRRVGEWTVQIGTAVYPAVVSLRPMYDPGNKRMRI